MYTTAIPFLTVSEGVWIILLVEAVFVQGYLWVELVKDLIVARVHGEATEELLKECQEKVLVLSRDTKTAKVLYDLLEMKPPASAEPLAQWKVDEKEEERLTRAFVVPNGELAYLTHVALGDGKHRVFYNDIVAAIEWLVHPKPDLDDLLDDEPWWLETGAGKDQEKILNKAD